MNKKIIIYVFAILLLSAAVLAVAQQVVIGVEGTVTDSAGKPFEGVVGANVDNAQGGITMTTDDGTFSLLVGSTNPVNLVCGSQHDLVVHVYPPGQDIEVGKYKFTACYGTAGDFTVPRNLVVTGSATVGGVATIGSNLVAYGTASTIGGLRLGAGYAGAATNLRTWTITTPDLGYHGGPEQGSALVIYGDVQISPGLETGPGSGTRLPGNLIVSGAIKPVTPQVIKFKQSYAYLDATPKDGTDQWAPWVHCPEGLSEAWLDNPTKIHHDFTKYFINGKGFKMVMPSGIYYYCNWDWGNTKSQCHDSYGNIETGSLETDGSGYNRKVRAKCPCEDTPSKDYCGCGIVCVWFELG